MRVFCLGPTDDAKGHELLYADIPLQKMRSSSYEQIHLSWKPLIVSTDPNANGFEIRQGSRAEFQQERQRLVTSGVTSYSYHVDTGMFMFTRGSRIMRYFEESQQLDSILFGPGDPLNPKVSPCLSHLLVCTADGSLFLVAWQDQSVIRLTKETSSYITSGEPAFVIQEEFDRYDGHWWQPKCSDPGFTYILYEETDMGPVSLLHLTEPGELLSVDELEHSDSPRIGCLAYPQAGAPNAKWRLKMIRLNLNKLTEVETLTLPIELVTMFPWAEYMVRAGWLPSGDAVWAQLMSRDQRRLSLVRIPLQCFVADPSTLSSEAVFPAISVLRDERVESGWIDVHEHLHFFQIGDHIPISQQPGCQDNAMNNTHANGGGFTTVIELTSDPATTNGESIEFLWSAQHTRHHHLYHVRTWIDKSMHPYTGVLLLDFTASTRAIIHAITEGPYDVPERSQWIVNERLNRVYFVAFKDSPVEPHIYSAPARPCTTTTNAAPEVVRLTPLGNSFWTRRAKDSFNVDATGSVLVATGSSLSSPPFCAIFSVSNVMKVAEVGLILDTTTAALTLPPAPPPVSTGTQFLGSVEPSTLATPNSAQNTNIIDNRSMSNSSQDSDIEVDHCIVYDQPAPEILSFVSDNTGRTHYALLFKPNKSSVEESPHFSAISRPVKYPTILFVYAGTEVQLVQNSYSCRYGLHRYTSLGYAVVCLDGRGSANRGCDFQEEIQYCMGTVEIDDQVEGLLKVAEMRGIIDLDRVAVRGWSYGGYASLMLLIRRPDLFKAAIAGAPVTMWELYDTAYTERYMGLPSENAAGYKRGSVVAQAHKLPAEPGRLLLMSGLIDDNVHFTHTTRLISALIRASRPHQLQLYPSSRHGVRTQIEREHLECTSMTFLQQALASGK